MRGRRGFTAAVVALAATVFCAGASAAPSALGPGSFPHIAVSPNGSAHVVWKDGAVKYCRLRPNGKGCAGGSRRELIDPESTEAFAFFDNRAPYVFAPSEEEVVVVESRGGAAEAVPGEEPPPARLLVHRSSDGGETFDSPAEIGDVEIAFSEAVAFENETVHAASTMAGGDTASGQPLFAQVAAVAGPQVTQRAELFTDSSRLGDYSAIAVHEGRPVVVWNHQEALFARLQSGEGDPNDERTWTPAASLGRRGGAFALESGRRGTFLLSVSPARTAKIRRLGTTTFGRARAVRGARNVGDVDLFQSDSGRLFSAWTRYRAGSNDYSLSFTSRAGSRWRAPTTLARAARINHPEVATDATGRKRFAVWTVSTPEGPSVRARKF